MKFKTAIHSPVEKLSKQNKKVAETAEIRDYTNIDVSSTLIAASS